ncbi:MAG: peptidoglycan DD-metalloendopeptidase family protein [Ilumatobacteraceae bacterium]
MLALLVVMSTTLPCYLPPVAAPITEPFVAPACAYCPGHRGVEYDVPIGTVVRAVAAGAVTFTGVVARIRYVIVLHVDGIRATYAMLRSSALSVGDALAVGDVVGLSSPRLYFGLRAPDDTPIDPADHLALVRRRARLVPVDGSPPRPAASRPPACAGTVAQPRENSTLIR